MNSPTLDRKEIMMEDEQKSPYDSHVFVCTNDRGGVRKSCADGNSQQTRARLKEELTNGAGRVGEGISMRLHGTLCQGPNVMIYPQQSGFRL